MTGLKTIVRGRAWCFGDSIDTEQLAGLGKLEGLSPEESLRASCMRGTRPDFAERVKPGDVVVAGTNFGCGSSRQTAVQALQLCGVGAVLAESVARIHMRNSIALGLPTFVVKGIGKNINEGDEVEVDYAAGKVRNRTQGVEFELPRLPATVEGIYDAGGILALMAQRLKQTEGAAQVV